MMSCRLLFLMAAIGLLGCLQTPNSVNAGESGIRGTVLVGPVHPGPQLVGQSGEAPLQASFDVFESEHKVASFESDETGKFEISLPPGEYSIVPGKSTPIPFAQRQRQVVSVPEEGFTSVILKFDSGLR